MKVEKVNGNWEFQLILERKKNPQIKMYDPDNNFVGDCSDSCTVLDSNIHITFLQW